MRKRKKAIENHDYPSLGGIRHRETQRGEELLMRNEL